MARSGRKSKSERDSISLKCPGCEGTFLVGAELAGRRAECARCGASLQIPKPPAKLPAKSPPQPLVDEWVGVACGTCDTPLYGHPNQIGQALVCPDCGAKTVLRAPKLVKKISPPALEGEQYELWDADDPGGWAKPPEAGAAKPFPVHCGLCQTLMYATDSQVGQPLTCPDCGSQTVANKPAEAPPVPSVLVATSEEYQLSATKPARPVPGALSKEQERQLLERQEAGRGGAIHDSQSQRRAKRRRKLDARGRPVLPKWPLATQIFPFLWEPGFFARVGFHSLSMLGLLGTIIWAFQKFLYVDFRAGPGAEAGEATFAFLIMVICVALSAVWLTTLAATLLAVVEESAAGNYEVDVQAIGGITDSLGLAVGLATSAAFSALPTGLLAQWIAHNAVEKAAWILGGMLLFFPVVLLSQLASGSVASIVVPGVVGSIVRRPIDWLMMVGWSALLAAVVIATAWAAFLWNPVAISLGSPLYVCVLMIYFRLIGRLGWAVSVASDDASSTASAASKRS